MKTAQIGSNQQSVEAFKKQMQNVVKDGTSPDDESKPAQQSPLKEVLKTSNEDSGNLTKSSKDTQLETKSNAVTLYTEQMRGSLLDLAV